MKSIWPQARSTPGMRTRTRARNRENKMEIQELISCYLDLLCSGTISKIDWINLNFHLSNKNMFNFYFNLPLQFDVTKWSQERYQVCFSNLLLTCLPDNCNFLPARLQVLGKQFNKFSEINHLISLKWLYLQVDQDGVFLGNNQV